MRRLSTLLILFVTFLISTHATAQLTEIKVNQEIQDSMLVLLKQKINWQKIDTAKNFWCDDYYILSYNKKGKLKNVMMHPRKNGIQSGEDQMFYFNLKNQCQLKMLKALRTYKLPKLETPAKFALHLTLLYKDNELEISSISMNLSNQ